MGRPRTFVEGHVVERAKETFWDRGYEATAIGDLEERTGLSRSSLYLAFGAKRSLFAVALDRYLDFFIEPLLATMEQPSAGIGDILTFFSRVNDVLLEDVTRGQRGCLMVNTIAELAGRDQAATERANAFVDRLRRAFAHALEDPDIRPRMSVGVIRRRASMLATATLGVWLTARIDPADAAALCDDLAAEVGSWRSRHPEFLRR